jgi:hypothetical protein
VDDRWSTYDTKLKNKNSRPLENILEEFHCIMDMKLEALYDPVQLHNISYATTLATFTPITLFSAMLKLFSPQKKKKTSKICEGKILNIQEYSLCRNGKKFEKNLIN